MKTKSDWLEYLGFYLEKQDDVWMVIDQIGESRTSTMPERVLWDALMEALSGVQALSAAPAPLSEMPYEKRKAIQEGELIGASDAWFKARHEMLDTVDRRNVFRAGFDRGWNAALAAQGGKDV